MVIYIHRGPEEVTDNHRRYWLALGRFVHSFAWIEGQAFTLFFEKVGVDRKTAQAVFSGVRTEDATSKLKRLCEARGELIPEAVSRAMDQLGLINTARNKILHYGATIKDGTFLVSDAHKTIPRAAYKGQFSPETIDQMTADLDTIAAAFYVWLIGPKAEAWDEMGINYSERGLAPWQYKPTGQDKTHPPTRGTPRKRERQPTPSQE